MDAEQINAIHRLAVTRPQPPVGSGEAGTPQSVPEAGTPPPPPQDTVTLSAQGQRVLQQGGGGDGEGNEGLHRELDVTDSNQVVLKIRDLTTQQVIKQIPPEEQVRLREAIQSIVAAQQQINSPSVDE